MKDRQPTQILANGAIRYGIYNADGTLDSYVYMRREDAPTVEGTPLCKATLLSDTTEAQIWRGAEKPDETTVDKALAKLAEGTAKVGDVLITGRTNLSEAWLPCDGRSVSSSEYPDLVSVLRTDVDYTPWSTLQIAAEGGPAKISCIQGTWISIYPTDDGICIAVSTDLVTFQTYTLAKSEFMVSGMPDDIASNFGNVAIPSRMLYIDGRYIFAVSPTYRGYAYPSVAYSETLDGPWTVVHCGTAHYGSNYQAEDYCEIFYNNGTYWVVTGAYVPRSGSFQNAYYMYKSIDEGNTWTSMMLETIGGEYELYSLNQSEVPGPIYSLSNVDSAYYRLYKTYDFETFTYTVTQQISTGYSSICYHDNTVIIFGSKQYAYSIDGGQTLTYKKYFETDDYFKLMAYTTAYYDGQICVATIRGQLNSESHYASRLLVSADITAKVNFLQGPERCGSIASKGNVYALTQRNSTQQPVYLYTQDYTYVDKHIPTIAPGPRGTAYIKALEE